MCMKTHHVDPVTFHETEAQPFKKKTQNVNAQVHKSCETYAKNPKMVLKIKIQK